MAKVGLKDTLALLAKGYSKKEIDELAALDEQEAKDAKENITEEVKQEEQPKEDPDYKEMYNALLKEKEEEVNKLRKENEETKGIVTKLQQDNIHENSAPAAAEAKAQEQESLNNLVRSFM